MYAVIEQGGKQHKVTVGDVFEFELMDIADDAKTVELDKVLFVGDEGTHKIGNPYVEGAKVIASFSTTAAEAVVKGVKVYPTYFRKRKNSMKRIGHRQKYIQVTIEKIEAWR